ncbi:MAG: hypothetical protein ACOYKA_07195 [Legionellaceae bacterium]
MMHHTSSSTSSTGSSREHRKAQRANGGTEILGQTISTISLIASLPPKVAQTFISGRACFFSTTLKPTERIAHGCQAFLTVTQIAIIIALYYQNDNCKDSDAPLCKTLRLCDLIYAGILLLNWSHSELNKNHSELTQQSRLSDGPQVAEESSDESRESPQAGQFSSQQIAVTL